MKQLLLLCLIAFSRAIYADSQIAHNYGIPGNTIDSDTYVINIAWQAAPNTPDGTYGVQLVYDGRTPTLFAEIAVTNGVCNPASSTYYPDPNGGGHPGRVLYLGVGTHTWHWQGNNVVSAEDATLAVSYVPWSPGIAQLVQGHTTIMVGGLPSDENQTKECDANTGCSNCKKGPMASYSIHLMLASLHIEDTPISYNSSRGPSPDFKVVYNQREANQPATFTYSNLGPKWTFNWLSYVTDNGPAAAAPNPTVYVRGGGTETYSGFNAGTQSYGPDKQTLAVLVRTSSSTYEKRFSDGSKEVFGVSDGANSYPRRIFLSSVIDAAGNATTLTYDTTFRLTAITDSLGQATTLTYGLTADPLKITKVTDPFLRFAAFEYTSGQLTKITDPIGIESRFEYASGSDFIRMMTTPYGPTTFARGETGTSMRWLEATDPLGGKERVEYNSAAANVVSTDASAPAGVYNNDLQFRNTFYWDKKAMTEAPGNYAKAQVFHWLVTPEGKISGIKHSEKKSLENRVWYSYPNQTDPTKVGSIALPTKVARVLDDGATQLFQYEYNSIGKTTKATDPAGRVMSYVYDVNNIDLLETRQTTGTNNELLRKFTYNSLHEPLTDTDAAGQITTYTYNPQGQIVSVTNAKNETTTYGYGDGTPGHPLGYLDSITSPQVNGVSAQQKFIYDSLFFGPSAPKRIACIIDEPDHYVAEYRYDNLDRVTSISAPDGSRTFEYADPVRGMTLDVTRSTDRRGRLTTRHYDANRHLDSVTDPLNRTTQYGWCTCGALVSITDPRGKVTMFGHDLQNRVTSRLFQDNTSISYFYENTTSRLKAIIDPRGQKTNYFYNADGTLRQTTYTDTNGQPLDPPTPSVSFIYDPNYNRVTTMTDGIGTTNYTYYPVGTPPSLGANQLETVDGPLNNDTITYSYDELGRMIGQSINGVASNVGYDSLGRLATSDNALGHFNRAYVSVTPRLQTLTYPNGQTANYSYFDNSKDRRLQTLQNLATGGANLSKFDYLPDAEGQVSTWTKQLGAAVPPLTGTYGYDLADQLTSATTATVAPPVNYSYGYDLGGNRTSDQVPPGTHTFNDVNETQDSDYAYDANGNLSSDGVKDYFWDAANRLIAVQTRVMTSGVTNSVSVTVTPTPTLPPLTTPPPDSSHGPSSNPSPTPILQALTVPVLVRSELSYDGFGRRAHIIEKQASSVDTNGDPVWSTVSDHRYVWSGNNLAEERDSTGAGVTRRFFAEGEQIGGTNYYFARDHLGSVREMTDSTGAVHAQYEYDPYGNRTKLSGDLDADFGFTGHWHHGPSGLNLSLYRGYSPTLGRWISRDPIGEEGGLNLYSYVHNSPTSRIDPLGLKAFWHYARCCNKSSRSEWASVAGIGWVLLPPGQCIGVFDGKDCEGMTCGGGFYYVQLDIGTCKNPGCDSWPYRNRRWTNNPATDAPGSMSPAQRGMVEFGNTPPGYQYGPRP